MRSLSHSAIVMLAAMLAVDGTRAASTSVEFADGVTRTWVGDGLWANRLQDWRVSGGRLECISGGLLPFRTVHLITHDLSDRNEASALSVRLGLVASGSSRQPAVAGFLVGVGHGEMDYRRAATVHYAGAEGAGWLTGITHYGQVFIDDFDDGYDPPAAGGPGLPVDTTLTLVNTPTGPDTMLLLLEAHDTATGTLLSQTSREVSATSLAGGVALIQNPAGAETRFWFDDWSLSGDKVDAQPDRVLGPILSCQHTLSARMLTLSAQLFPIDVALGGFAELEANTGGGWSVLASEAVSPASFVVTFRVPDWDDSRDTPYRVRYDYEDGPGMPRSAIYEGVIRRDPVDQDQLVLAAFTGCDPVYTSPGSASFDWPTGMYFPHEDLTARVAVHDPDLLFFSGDQIYENRPSGADYSELERDYLYKWYLWCWAFRDLTRDTPAIIVPDDHDVYQGNLWGEGGIAATIPGEGGYTQPASFINLVHNTQTSNLPPPYDPTPVAQDISVYYTDVTYGRVSFAVLADRQWKHGWRNEPLLPSWLTSVLITDPQYDTSELDVPGLDLLGARQHAFLSVWSQDWTGADMKAALSQSIWSHLTTHTHNTFKYADMDCNGWPQTQRNIAVDYLRRCYATHISGDQHLGLLAHLGIDAHNDATYAFMVPSVANFYPRRWEPLESGQNPEPNAPTYTGEFIDGFGHPVTVYAASNPNGSVGFEPAHLHDRMPGYGIVRFDKSARTITYECWPRYADPGVHAQYAGWPRTINQADNYARTPASYLPQLHGHCLNDPVVLVYQAGSGDLVHALRITGGMYQPVVFDAPGTLYDVVVGAPDYDVWSVYSGIASGASPEDAGTLEIAVDTFTLWPDFLDCAGGPQRAPSAIRCGVLFDCDGDTDIDLVDFSVLCLGAMGSYAHGDLNCDGWVNNGDIDAFIFAVSYPDQYASEYPGCNIMLGDINGDGWMNNGDIDAFVALLGG